MQQVIPANTLFEKITPLIKSYDDIEKYIADNEFARNILLYLQNTGTLYVDKLLRSYGLSESSNKFGQFMSNIGDTSIMSTLTSQDLDQLKTIERPAYEGIYGDYISCGVTVDKLKERYIALDDEYTLEKPYGGGKSGAYVFLVSRKSDKSKKYILKLYTLRILDAIDDRDFREIFTTCSLSGVYAFPTVVDFGSTNYDEKSKFFKTFKERYLDCVGNDKDKFKNNLLYTKVNYVVTTISPGKELNKVDLFSYEQYQLYGILYQLALSFSKANEKMIYFIHNDLHPGNIFIDDSTKNILVYRDTKNKVDIYGPKISIIDLDLAISLEYPRNLASLRAYGGIVLVQEAIMSLFNNLLGLNATFELIWYTSKVWFPQLVGGNDDFRLWLMYKMLFDVIIIAKNNKQYDPNNKNIPSQYVSDIVNKVVIINNKFISESGIKISEILKEYNEKDLSTLIPNSNQENFDKFIKYIASHKNYLQKDTPMINDYNKLLQQTPQKQLSMSTDYENEINKLIDLFLTQIGFDIPYFKTIFGDQLEWIKKNLMILDKEVYEKTKQHFGIHNIEYGIEISFKNDKDVELFLYDKWQKHLIKINKQTSNKESTIKININAELYMIKIKNISINYGGNFKFISSLVSYFTQDIEILINKNTGKIYSGSGLIDEFFNYFMQTKIKNLLDCPGIKTNLFALVNNIAPIITSLFDQINSQKLIKSTKIFIGNKSKRVNDDEPKDTGKEIVTREETFDLISSIEKTRSFIDKKIARLIENIQKNFFPKSVQKSNLIDKSSDRQKLEEIRSKHIKESEQIKQIGIPNIKWLGQLANEINYDDVNEFMVGGNDEKSLKETEELKKELSEYIKKNPNEEKTFSRENVLRKKKETKEFLYECIIEIKKWVYDNVINADLKNKSENDLKLLGTNTQDANKYMKGISEYIKNPPIVYVIPSGIVLGFTVEAKGVQLPQITNNIFIDLIKNVFDQYIKNNIQNIIILKQKYDIFKQVINNVNNMVDLRKNFISYVKQLINSEDNRNYLYLRSAYFNNVNKAIDVYIKNLLLDERKKFLESKINNEFVIFDYTNEKFKYYPDNMTILDMVVNHLPSTEKMESLKQLNDTKNNISNIDDCSTFPWKDIINIIGTNITITDKILDVTRFEDKKNVNITNKTTNDVINEIIDCVSRYNKKNINNQLVITITDGTNTLTSMKIIEGGSSSNVFYRKYMKYKHKYITFKKSI